MKTVKFVIAMMIMGCFALSTANAQAVVVKDQTWTVWGYYSIDSHRVVTPEGDINIWVEWEFNVGDWMVPEKGVAVHYIYAYIVIDGYEYYIPGVIKVRKDGSAKGNWHWPPELT